VDDRPKCYICQKEITEGEEVLRLEPSDGGEVIYAHPKCIPDGEMQ